MDAGNLLKPMLARGELHCIGATTLDEYRKHIEKDAALERRFQPVVVDQPSVEDAISILRGLRERFELHHGVRIQDNALVSAVILSHRYISDRFLPDKAIDLVDEACAMIRTEMDSMPPGARRAHPPGAAARDRGDRAGQGEGRRQQARGSTALRKELAEVGEQAKGLQAAVGEGEGGGRTGSARSARSSRQARLEMEKAERGYDLNKVAELRHGRIPQLEAELRKLEKAGHRRRRCSRRRSPRRRSPRSSPSGRAFRSPGWSRARRRSSSASRRCCTGA